MECQGDGIAVVQETTKVNHEKASEDGNENGSACSNEDYDPPGTYVIYNSAKVSEITSPQDENGNIITEDIKSGDIPEGIDCRVGKPEARDFTADTKDCCTQVRGYRDVAMTYRSKYYGTDAGVNTDVQGVSNLLSETSLENCLDSKENLPGYEREDCGPSEIYNVIYTNSESSQEGTSAEPKLIKEEDPPDGRDVATETKSTSPRTPDYCERPSTGSSFTPMCGPDTAVNSDVLQGIPGLPSEQLLECRHDIISSTAINPYSSHGYGSGPETDSPCYFLSSSRQIFTVVESVVHFLTQPVVNFIRGEWIVSFVPFPIAQHVCISLDDGMKRYEEVLKVEPNFDNPRRVDLITVEHRLVPGNTMHRPRFREALRQSLTEIGKQLSGEAPWEIFVSRASGRSLAMDTMIHSFLSESHEPLETHCSPLVEHTCTPIFAKLTAAPYTIVGSIFRPVLRYASWLVVSSHYQLHETISLNLNYKTRRIEATSLDSAVARSSFSEDLGPSVILLDAVSYVSDSLTGNAVLSSNSLLGRNLHPFLNFDSNPIFNRGTNPCFNATFAPPSSNSNVPVSSVGLIITPPGHGAQMGIIESYTDSVDRQAPNQVPQQQQPQGNFAVANQYPAPLFAYSPYGLLQQVVPPIPIVQDNFYAASAPPPAPYGHFIEMQRQDLNLNPHAQDFYPDAPGERPATTESFTGSYEHEMSSSVKQSTSETTLQLSHCQVTGTFIHRSPSTYDSEPGIVMVRAHDSQSEATNDTGTATRSHSKSWSEETEIGEHEFIEGYQYSRGSPGTYEEQPILMDNSYGNDNPHGPDYHSRRNEQYPRGNYVNYGNYKPRFAPPNPSGNRYPANNDYSHGNESPRQNQHGNYSPSDRPPSAGHYYNNRGRGGRGRSYNKKPHYNNQGQGGQNEGSYYRRGNRYNNNNPNPNYKKAPPAPAE